MIPAHPEFDPKSYENLIFDALKALPDDCFILHSLSILDPENSSSKKETEIDFVVIIPDVGCIVIEAKSGETKFTSETTYFEGEEIPPYTWVYETGRPMKGNGPFRQASDNKYILMDYLKRSPYEKTAMKQRFYHCIWLHQKKRKDIEKFEDRPECPKDIILSKEDLKTPLESLMKVIDFGNKFFNAQNFKPWNYEKASIIVSHVLAPTMNLVPGKNWEYEYKKAELNKLLIEQERILEFLSEQKIAVISGAAGTGKTMIAIKKAELESNLGKKVLFLCYNAALANFLKENYKKANIDYFNISQWACQLCHSTEPDYGALSAIIENQVNSESFPYQVVVVDEAQDFGQEIIDNDQVNVLSKLHDAMILLDGLFYLFYDKNQIVNSSRLPDYIKDADCKLTLYRNCRNTKKIADASMKVLNKDPKFGPNVVEGNTPSIIFVDDKNEKNVLSYYADKMMQKYNNVVILSAKSLNTTSLYESVNEQNITLKGKKYPFYTCRQFKGLESDAVILVDVDSTTFSDNKNKLLYYVGTSRAKFELVILAKITDEECESLCKALLGDSYIEGFDNREQLTMALAVGAETPSEK